MKEKYWRQACKIIIFCIIGTLLLSRLYRVLSWKDTAGDYLSTMETFYQLDKDTVDVLFLGSSHSYCAVNTAKMWEDYGIAVYSLAISGQDLASSYHCLVEALKTQHPKVVCLEMYYSVLHGYAVDGNMYRNLLSYKLSRNFVRTVNDIAPEEQRKDLIAKWPIVHTRYKELQKEDFMKEYPVYMGYTESFQKDSNVTEQFYDGEETVPIGEEEEEWLNKIQELAEENGIELCYFLAPYVTDEYTFMKHNYVRELAENQGITYLDFVAMRNEIGLNTAEDFLDWGHLNHNGAQKITTYLENYLVRNHQLEDCRGLKQYALWDRNLEARHHEGTNWDLQSVIGITPYLNRIASLDNYAIIFTSDGGCYPEGIDLSSALERQPWLEDVYYAGGACIWDNGEVKDVITEKSGMISCKIGQYDVTVVRSENHDHIFVDGQEYNKVSDGINIVVIDKILDCEADVVGFSADSQFNAVR